MPNKTINYQDEELHIDEALTLARDYARAVGSITLDYVTRKAKLTLESLKRAEGHNWPPHNILCGELNPTCYKCGLKPRKYTKAIKE